MMRRREVRLLLLLAVKNAEERVTAAVRVRTNAVTEWNLITVNALVNPPGPAGGAPPAAQINVGMTHG
jgi:hypothetical protein